MESCELCYPYARTPANHRGTGYMQEQPHNRTSRNLDNNAEDPVPMTLAGQNPVAHLLDGMLRCRTCYGHLETTYEVAGETPRYACSPRPRGCGSLGILAEPFAKLVVTTVVRAALEGGNTQQVAEIVQADAKQRSEDYTSAKLDDVFRSMDFQDPLMLAPHPSEYIPEPDPDTRRLLELDPAQYIEPLRRLNRYWNSTGDSGHIEWYAQDLDTYLRPSNLQTTRAIIETAVAEVEVGPVSAIIKYRTPMPPGSGADGEPQEEVPIPFWQWRRPE